MHCLYTNHDCITVYMVCILLIYYFTTCIYNSLIYIGIFTAHAAIELYAEAFDSVNALDKLEGFTSIYGQQFYNIPINTTKIVLKKEAWTVPDFLGFGASKIRPLRAGQSVAWKIVE